MREKETVESKVRKAVMQEPLTVTIGGKRYDVAPPTIGTLILVSEILARVPDIEEGLDSGADRAKAVLQRAKEFKVLPELYATLILGSCRINETVVVEGKRKGILRRRDRQEMRLYDLLVNEIRDKVAIEEMRKIIPFLISGLQLSDFFVLTTFLREIQLTKPKKVEKKTTASGR